jgi:hypothetical protein
MPSTQSCRTSLRSTRTWHGIPEKGPPGGKGRSADLRSNVAGLSCGRGQKGLAIEGDWSGSCRQSRAPRALARSCPAGVVAEVGLRWCGATAPRAEMEDLGDQTLEKAITCNVSINCGCC